MGKNGYKLISQDSLPKTSRRKRSKYDQMLYSFHNGTEDLCKLTLTDDNISRNPHMVANQLRRRCDILNLSINIYVRNNEVYLKKTVKI